MTPRVYLFADFGKGPRHMGRAWNQATAEPIPYRTALHAAALAGTQYVIAGPVALLATAARAWWLVECESAEHGRTAIKLYAGGHDVQTFGRILASGGAA